MPALNNFLPEEIEAGTGTTGARRNQDVALRVPEERPISGESRIIRGTIQNHPQEDVLVVGDFFFFFSVPASEKHSRCFAVV